MQPTHNSQRIPIICQFYDYLNRVNIIFHRKTKSKSSLISFKSLTYNLNPCLDYIRLKSEIRNISCRGNEFECAEEIQLCEGELPWRTRADFALENTICFQAGVP